MKFTWAIAETIENPCTTCNGCGSEWARRKDGQPDRRYVHPIGPCRACGGTRQQ